MLIGRELAKRLKVKLGDHLRLVVPSDLALGDQPSGAGETASREFRVVGIFYAGFDEYDRRLAYVSLKDAQALLGGSDYVTGVELRLHDLDRAPVLAKALLDRLGGSPYRVIDWQELNHNLFTAVKTQKSVLVIFLTLIILVAAFNIVAALTMLVVDKTREVAILKSMGLPPGGAARIFQVAGLSIGALGAALGLGLGLLLCHVVSRYGYSLDPHVYLIDRLPVRVSGVELGYTVFEPDRRRGYASEACRGMMDWAARNHGVTRFVVSIGLGNVASLAMAKRLGFLRVGSCTDLVDGPEDVFVRELAAFSAGPDS